MNQSGVGELSSVELKLPQTCQLLEMEDPLVGDLAGATGIERLQLGQSLEMQESGVADPGTAEVERLQVGQAL